MSASLVPPHQWTPHPPASRTRTKLWSPLDHPMKVSQKKCLMYYWKFLFSLNLSPRKEGSPPEQENSMHYRHWRTKKELQRKEVKKKSGNNKTVIKRTKEEAERGRKEERKSWEKRKKLLRRNRKENISWSWQGWSTRGPLEGLELSSKDDAVCPKCGKNYTDDESDGPWICCDRCNSWFDLKCTNFGSKRSTSDAYFCEKCT